MNNRKKTIQFLVVAIVTAMLTTAFWKWYEADDIESPTNKAEWGVLQAIEYDNRRIPISGMEFHNVDGHMLVCLATHGGRLWIMMDAAGSTRYKQMGADSNFTITKQQFEKIIARGKPSSTVERALASHLE